MRSLLLSLALGLSFASPVAGCRDPQPPPPTGECSEACSYLASLPDDLPGGDPQKPCPLSQPTPDGTTCQAYCELYGRAERRSGIDPRCMKQAKTCSEADRCTQTRTGR